MFIQETGLFTQRNADSDWVGPEESNKKAFGAWLPAFSPMQTLTYSISLMLLLTRYVVLCRVSLVQKVLLGKQVQLVPRDLQENLAQRVSAVFLALWWVHCTLCSFPTISLLYIFLWRKPNGLLLIGRTRVTWSSRSRWPTRSLGKYPSYSISKKKNPSKIFH